jgi:hypothetical protein
LLSNLTQVKWQNNAILGQQSTDLVAHLRPAAD